ncbi:MAG: hypothetical protein R3C61_04725 [Bacteroidia bacterium]
MKPVCFVLSLLLFCMVAVRAQQPEMEPGQLEIRINHQLVTPEEFGRYIFCMNGNDTISLAYLPMDVVESEDYVLFNIELVAQANLGQPQFMGRIDKSEPGKTPEISFRLAQLQTSAILAPTANAIRGSLQVQSVLKVSGNRMLEVINLGEKGLLPLNMVPVCPLK